jgi:hypothetical protein
MNVIERLEAAESMLVVLGERTGGTLTMGEVARYDELRSKAAALRMHQPVAPEVEQAEHEKASTELLARMVIA